MNLVAQQTEKHVCDWCEVFAAHLQDLMLAALYLSGNVERVEEIVLEALDAAIAQREIAASSSAARRFVLRTALHATWRALRPEQPETVLAAA